MSDNVIGNIILEGAVTVEDSVITNTGGRRVEAEGILQDMDVENRNRRIYAKSDLLPEINGARMKELINTGNFKGEDGHPLSEDLVRQQTIDPKKVSVKFTKIWADGNLVRGRFMGTNTELGKAFDQDLRDGEKPSFSLRALGSIENIQGKAYVKNIKIITWDRVYYPSHKKAYTEKIVTESAMNGSPIYTNQLVVPYNDPGTIITLRESDAKTVLNRLQRESASVSTILETFNGVYDKIDLLNEHTLMMTSKYGDKMYARLEDHVDNVIMNYVFKM